MKVLPMWRSGCFSLPKRLAAGSLAACLLLAQPATFAAAGDELRGIIEIDDPVVKRMQVVPISEAPRKDYWPRVVEGIKWAYRERPAELKDWEALGLSLAGQRRRFRFSDPRRGEPVHFGPRLGSRGCTGPQH